ncbi:MAG: MFS transporter [Oscillospiraceae bacterium]
MENDIINLQKTAPICTYNNWQKRTAWFLSGQAISLFGSALTQFAIVWHITLSTSSGVMLMISTLCSFLPQILISLFAGVWADRHNRKRLIIMADGMIAVATLVSALVFMTGYKELWILFVISAVRSVGSGVQSPAVNALIPQLVPKEKLMRINGINGTIQSLTLMAAPAVSGGILSLFGLQAAFFIDVITAVIGIGILLFIKVDKVKRNLNQEEKGVLADLKEGVKYTWEHPFLRTFLFCYGIMMFLVTPACILTPLMVARSFGEEVWRLTANEMLWSVGTVIGGIIISVWGGCKNRLHTLILGTILYGLFTAALGISTNFTAYLIFLFIAGASMPLINSTGMVVLQETVELNMQGRVFSLVQILASSAIPLGMTIFGPASDLIKIEYMLILTGLLLMVLGVFMLFNRNIKSGNIN